MELGTTHPVIQHYIPEEISHKAILLWEPPFLHSSWLLVLLWCIFF